MNNLAKALESTVQQVSRGNARAAAVRDGEALATALAQPAHDAALARTLYLSLYDCRAMLSAECGRDVVNLLCSELVEAAVAPTAQRAQAQDRGLAALVCLRNFVAQAPALRLSIAALPAACDLAATLNAAGRKTASMRAAVMVAECLQLSAPCREIASEGAGAVWPLLLCMLGSREEVSDPALGAIDAIARNSQCPATLAILATVMLDLVPLLVRKSWSASGTTARTIATLHCTPARLHYARVYIHLQRMREGRIGNPKSHSVAPKA